MDQKRSSGMAIPTLISVNQTPNFLNHSVPGLSVGRPNPNSLPDIGLLGICITSLGGDRLTFISAGACAHGILRLTTS